MKLSVCGIDCDACRFASERNCPGCRAQEGKPFWGSCALYACAAEKGLPHCGKCGEFPCSTLREWASAENPERIDNLRKS
ncbi:MAG: DUF3795 domain-containing protein [Christensenellaceae bacterium]|nr:DUF3795 domain-containing protein [Christensenellaceae bacterium]